MSESAEQALELIALLTASGMFMGLVAAVAGRK